MIPLRDENPTRRFPLVTVLLIAVNLYVYFQVQRPWDQDQTRFAYAYAAVPCELIEGEPLSRRELLRLDRGDTEGCDRFRDPGSVGTSRPVFPQKDVYLAVIYSMFLHGSLVHIGGNMLFLWIFGNNIEDRMGAVGYIAFYLAAGLVATAAHVVVQPGSTVPVVGASGAIAGVMGAYMVLFPDAPIRTLLFFFVIVFLRDIPAKWLLAFWFVLQFFTNPSAGVAWVAHVGGFVFGVLVALLLRDRLRPVRAAAPSPAWW